MPEAAAVRGETGFTLIELMIALAVAGVVLALGVPGYRDWVAGYQLANHAQQLASSLAYARAEALKRGTRVNLCPSADGLHCGDADGWAAGWLVYVDRNRDGRVDAGEPVLRVETPVTPGIRVAANRPLEAYVSFTGAGGSRLLNGGLQMGTFIVCKQGMPGIKVVLANSGRVRTEKTGEACAD